MDDLVSNCLGAALGLLLYKAGTKHSQTENWMRQIMLTAGLIGCIMVAVPVAKSNTPIRITEQFQFSISSLTVDDTVHIEGECYLYDRSTPEYTIFVEGVPANTIVDGKMFSAEAPSVNHKVKVEIRFKGRPMMPTGIWLRPMASGAEIEYVSGEEPVIPDLPETAVLKAWNEEYDTLVYQVGERLLWLIGTEIDKNTEVIYHIHTNEPEQLPENRIQHGFDNRGFRVGAEQAENELASIDHYRVFEREISGEYNVTAVVVGFNTDGTITWSDSFRIE